MKTSSLRPGSSASQSSDSPASLARLTWALRSLGFFSGGAVMIVEFSGNRLLSPIFGNSLFTWTGLIGVILIALSCGDYLGGWLVDRFENSLLLPALFALGGALTAAIPALAGFLPAAATLDVVYGPVLSSLLLFFLPGLVLAAVTPVSIRLLSKAYGDHRIGRAAGTVGMAAALGSFAGTFLTSYALIPNFGVRKIFVILGVTLLAVSALLAWLLRMKADARWMCGVVTVLGLGAAAVSSRSEPREENVIYARDTFYHRISVLETPGARGKPTRFLKLDSTMEGGQEVATGEVAFEYQRYWALVEVFSPELRRTVFLGAGAFGMPERLSERFPEALIDVVEIDPEVIEVGRRFFRLDEFPRVHAHAADARRFLQTHPESYDFIFGDAYQGVQYVPAHLVTREFFATVAGRLRPDGVYMMNVIGAMRGAGSEFFWRVYHSLRPSFPHVVVFGTLSFNPHHQQNLLVVASREPIEPRIERWKAGHSDRSLAQWALLKTRCNLPAEPEYRGGFSDDYNPVEYVVARQLRALRAAR
ncbi:MAG: fused MFS/spermidine synthase [Verrucomicrobiota bacterium]|nr:fused MFS/spermidine synthase [Verrucomicrobiota bacterium]